jgi:hypothetical protein
MIQPGDPVADPVAAYPGYRVPPRSTTVRLRVLDSQESPLVQSLYQWVYGTGTATEAGCHRFLEAAAHFIRGTGGPAQDVCQGHCFQVGKTTLIVAIHAHSTIVLFVLIVMQIRVRQVLLCKGTGLGGAN